MPRYLNAVASAGPVTNESHPRLSFQFADCYEPHPQKGTIRCQGVLARDQITRDWMELYLTTPILPEDCSHEREVRLAYRATKEETPHHYKVPIPPYVAKPPLPGDDVVVHLDHRFQLGVKASFLCDEEHVLVAQDAFTRQYVAHIQGSNPK